MNYKKSIVITGGAGFIGSHVVRLFVNKYPEYIIINLDKLTYAGNLANLKDVEDKPNYKFVKMDICDFEDFRKLIEDEQVDGIIHLAAESHVDRSIKDPFTFAHTNVIGTLSLLQAAKDYWGNQPKPWHLAKNGEDVACRFYHISTDEVYGALELTNPEGIESPFTTKASSDHHHAYGTEFFTEETKYRPHSPYSASKASSDHFVRAFHDTYGMRQLSQIAPTTMGLTSSQRNSSHCSSTISAIVSLCLCMARARMCATGFTWKTMPVPLILSSIRERLPTPII